MPTPIEILLDPVYRWAFLALYGALMLMGSHCARSQAGQRSKGWIPRALGSFAVYFYLSSYLPLIWDGYLASTSCSISVAWVCWLAPHRRICLRGPGVRLASHVASDGLVVPQFSPDASQCRTHGHLMAPSTSARWIWPGSRYLEA